MDEFKKEKNNELIDKAIEYLEKLKENDDVQEFLEVRIVTDESLLHQDFNVYISLDLEKAIN